MVQIELLKPFYRMISDILLFRLILHSRGSTKFRGQGFHLGFVAVFVLCIDRLDREIIDPL